MMAMESPRVQADVIEANEFPELSQRFRVSAVPKTVINGTSEVLGGLPEPQFLQKVLASLKQ